MLEAYNQIAISYLPKTNERYQVHKRAELKNVYKNIINLSKESPLYKIDLSKENQKYTLEVKEKATELQCIIDGLIDKESGMFTPTSAHSSDEATVSAEIIGEARKSMPRVLEITPKQMAKKQVNIGNSLYHRAPGLDAGGYRLNLLTNDGNHAINLFFEVKSTNLEQQNQIVKEINHLEIGIDAQVVEDEKEGYFHIELMGEDTVRLNCAPFIFMDQYEDMEGPVEYFGLGKIKDNPREAIFKLAGRTTIARQNQIVIGDSVHLTIKNEEQQPVTVRLIPDNEKIFQTMCGFAEGYNRMIKMAEARTYQSKDHIGAAKLLRRYQAITNSFQKELDGCGIEILSDGTLDIKKEKLEEAVGNGTLESELHNKTGFFHTMRSKSSEVSINPVEYIEKTIVTYPNVDKSTYPNPYITSMYSGMLFNFYC